MADIKALAESAQRKLSNGEALQRIDAARKAINGSGVFDKRDVEHLKKRVLAEMFQREQKEKPHVPAN